MPRGNRTKTVKKLAGAGSCRDSAAASCGDGNHVCMVYPDRAGLHQRYADGRYHQQRRYRSADFSECRRPFEKTCDLVLSGNPESLKPLSTADLDHFYRATAQNQDGISVLYASADNRVDTDAIHGTVYLKCENAPCRVYFNQSELNLGSDAQALAAMRLGMKITSHTGTTTYFWKLDDLGSTGGAESKQTTARTSAVVSSVSESGQPVYTDDPSQNLLGFFAGQANGSYSAGSETVVELNADEVAAVEYWLYLEGCDEQCINAVQSRSSEIQFAFVGVDADGNE